jgi:hypothetical protein
MALQAIGEGANLRVANYRNRPETMTSKMHTKLHSHIFEGNLIQHRYAHHADANSCIYIVWCSVMINKSIECLIIYFFRA